MNYVLIYPDEMRAESLACYGHPLVETPNIDALAAEGTVFTKNYTQHPVCTASRNALVTGCYPHVHGFRSLKHLLSENDSTFVRELREYGFETCFGGKSDCWNQSGTEHAFSDVDPALDWRFYDLGGIKRLYEKNQTSPPAPITPEQYTMLNPAIAEDKPMEEETGDAKVTAWACRTIEKHAAAGKDFFLMLSLHNPHPSYEALERYYDKYDPDQVPPLRPMEWFENKPEFYQIIREYRKLGEKEESIFRKINAVYLGMISYVDELVGRVVNTTKNTGIYDDTTFILCSDHGDFAGDCGLVEKWPSGMDDMLTRVPLIIRRPGCKGGHRVDTPTESIDIFPTIFDFEGLKAKHPHFGTSLAPQVEGAKGNETRTVYCEGGYDVHEPHCFEGTPLFAMHLVEGSVYYPKMMQQQELPDSVCRVIMQRDNRYKLNVRTNGQNELYDMEKDPLEYKNLYNEPEYLSIRTELTQKMLNWLIRTSDVTPFEGHFLPED